MIQNAKVVGAGIDADSYHRQEAQRGSLEFAMSPSQIKEFARCPDRWQRGYNPPGSDAKAYGSLLDCRILTPELFERRYAVTPGKYASKGMECPSCKSVTDSKSCRKCGNVTRVEVTIEREWNGNSEICQEWIKAQGNREIVSSKEVSECDEAITRLRGDEVIAAFLDASDRQVLVVGEWMDEETKLVIPIRCLLDLVPRPDTEFAKSLADLKAVRSAALIPFQRQCYQYGWHLQAAFDTDLYVAATGEDRCNWCFIAQESYEPWQPAKRLLTQDFIDIGRSAYRKHLALYCACLKAKKWPSYDDNDEAVQGWSLCRPEPFMESEGMFSPKLILDVPDDEHRESDDVGLILPTLMDGIPLTPGN